MKTFDVPDTIPLTKVQEFLRDLGIPTTDLREFRCGVSGVYVEVYAHNEKGQRYLEPGRLQPAMHRIAIPLDRDS